MSMSYIFSTQVIGTLWNGDKEAQATQLRMITLDQLLSHTICSDYAC